MIVVPRCDECERVLLGAELMLPLSTGFFPLADDVPRYRLCYSCSAEVAEYETHRMRRRTDRPSQVRGS